MTVATQHCVARPSIDLTSRVSLIDKPPSVTMSTAGPRSHTPNSLRASGTDKLVIVNGHGGNYVLSNVVQEANAAYPRSMALFPGRGDWNAARSAAEMKTNSSEDMHGGELEASILLQVAADQVRDGYQSDDHEAADRPRLLTLGMEAYATNGIIGSPSLATAEKGEIPLAALTERFEEDLGVLTR